jgi:hypothetical protein
MVNFGSECVKPLLCTKTQNETCHWNFVCWTKERIIKVAENSNKLYCSAYSSTTYSSTTYNSTTCLQFILIFLFFCLMGKGPGVLNTVLKQKHQLFNPLANVSEATGNSYTAVLAVTKRTQHTVTLS